MVLNNMEHLFFHFRRGHNIELTGRHDQQEFFMMCLGCWKTDHLKHGIETPIDLILEASLDPVVHDCKMGVSDPSIN